MRRRYIRVPAERKDDVAALVVSGALAACVGAVTFYLTRTFLARELLEPEEGRPSLASGDDEEEGGGRE